MPGAQDDHLAAEIETESRYPRGWSGNAGFAGWKIAVAVAMVLGVPVSIWVLITIFFR